MRIAPSNHFDIYALVATVTLVAFSEGEAALN
jgi:hypothetical protein